MDRRYIKDLPEDIKTKIAAALDVPEQPNWRSLIQNVIRQHIPYDNTFVTKIGMETLLPGGSPTLKLLNDLGQRGITVGVLINWISSINEMTTSLQAVLNLLSRFTHLSHLLKVAT